MISESTTLAFRYSLPTTRGSSSVVKYWRGFDSEFKIKGIICGVCVKLACGAFVCVLLRVRVVLYRVAVRSAAALRSPPGRTNRRLTRNESRYHSGESLHYKEPYALFVDASVIGVV